MTASLDHPLRGLPSAIIDAGEAPIRKRLNPTNRPSVLYHFTDAAGLIGIVTNRELWATMSTSMNDCSEITYGVELAAQVIEERLAQHGDNEFLGAARYYVTDPMEAPIRLYLPAFLISFCRHVGSSAHWLHYGRSGAGVAVGLKTDAIMGPPFDLAQVDYEPESQKRFIGEILDACEAVLRTSLTTVPGGDLVQRQRMAGHVTSLHLRLAATTFKDPAFKSEEEWRLITRQLWENGKQVDPPEAQGGPTRYRASGGRVLAYEVLDLRTREEKPRPPVLEELVLGYSCQMEVDDHSLGMMLAGVTGAAVPICRSTVPVRP